MTRASNINPLELIRILHVAGRALLSQASLHGQLVRVEWAEQRNRLLQMLVVTLLGFASLLCAMIFAGVIALALSWDTVYRNPVATSVTVIYGLAAILSWGRLRTLSASGRAFAATREELAADLAIIRSNL